MEGVMIKPYFKKQDGFSLLEVLIALVILAIGLLAVAQMQITAIKSNAYGSGMTSASSLASNTIERLMALPFTDPALLPTIAPPPAPDVTNGTTDGIGLVEGGVNNQGYTRVYWVQGDTPRAGLSQITVRVVWTDSNGMTRNVTMVTQRAQ
jgi:type IV pilus assembly protein PilV